MDGHPPEGYCPVIFSSRMKALLLLPALLLPALPCLARLGETRDQCIARYGKPYGGDENQLIFEKEGIQIVVDFYKGRADYLAFANVYAPGTRAKPLTAEEVSQLLEKNRGNETWFAKPASDGRKIWTAPTRFAELNDIGELVISNQEYPKGGGAQNGAPVRVPAPAGAKDRLREF